MEPRIIDRIPHFSAAPAYINREFRYTFMAPKAGRTMELVVFFSAAGRIVLAAAALAVSAASAEGHDCCGTSGIMVRFFLKWPMYGHICWSATVLAARVASPWFGGWQLTKKRLLYVFAVDAVLVSSTFGSAFGAYSVGEFAAPGKICTTTATVCEMLGYSGALAQAVVPLGAVSALASLISMQHYPLDCAAVKTYQCVDVNMLSSLGS